MHMLTHRLQILLEEDRYRQLVREAQRRRTSVAALIRQAVDREISADLDRRKAGVAAVLAAEPIDLPSDPADLRRELDEAHDRLQ